MADVVKDMEDVYVSDKPAGGQKTGGEGNRSRGQDYQVKRGNQHHPGGSGPRDGREYQANRPVQQSSQHAFTSHGIQSRGGGGGGYNNSRGSSGGRDYNNPRSGNQQRGRSGDYNWSNNKQSTKGLSEKRDGETDCVTEEALAEGGSGHEGSESDWEGSNQQQSGERDQERRGQQQSGERDQDRRGQQQSGDKDQERRGQQQSGDKDQERRGQQQAGERDQERRGQQQSGDKDQERRGQQQSRDRSSDLQRSGDRGVKAFIKELDGDLFTAPLDFSLAHCVANDLRMGSGIAVTFRSKFGRIGELLDQRKDVGEVAILDEKGRFVYYLITKWLSRDKPTMKSLRSSLEAMKRHCCSHNVTKLAMPRIGCGLDRLDWTEVKAMLAEIFADSGVAITVYNYPQADDQKDVDAAPKKKAALYITHHKQSLVTIASGTGLIYFISEETAENSVSRSLDEKHRFLQLVRTVPRSLGKVVRTERGNEVFYGLVVKKREKDRISYTAMVDCFKQLRKLNQTDSFEYFGIEAFRDGKDKIATEKVITCLRNMFSIIQYRLDIWICWPEDIQGDHDWSLDMPAGGGAAK